MRMFISILLLGTVAAISQPAATVITNGNLRIVTFVEVIGGHTATAKRTIPRSDPPSPGNFPERPRNKAIKVATRHKLAQPANSVLRRLSDKNGFVPASADQLRLQISFYAPDNVVSLTFESDGMHDYYIQATADFYQWTPVALIPGSLGPGLWSFDYSPTEPTFWRLQQN